MAQLAEQLICNQQVIGSSPIIGLQNSICSELNIYLDGFPSGQRGQTVNLLQIASVVRIHLHPLAERRCADVAQLAEQLICNQQVIGSSPIIGLISIEIINFISRDGAVWKLVGLITRRS